MPKRSFGDVIKRLMGVLLTSNTPLSTREIAKRAGVDWRTARKFLSILSDFSKAGILTNIRRGPSVLWRLERRILSGTPEMSQRLKFVFETFDFLYDIRDVARGRG